MNDRKDDIIIGLLVIIIIMQVYTLFFGTPGAGPAAPATVTATPDTPPGGWPEATADPEQRGQASPGAVPPSVDGAPPAGEGGPPSAPPPPPTGAPPPSAGEAPPSEGGQPPPGQSPPPPGP